MVYEFEGHTEKEAIDMAAAELSLDRDRFDVEIIEAQKGTIFKKGLVKIRVHTDEPAASSFRSDKKDNDTSKSESLTPAEAADFETKMITFIEKIIELMGYESSVKVLSRERDKLSLRIDSIDSSAIIGHKGKTLDALQLLATIYAGTIGHREKKVILDSENYRIHREETLVKLAYNVADRVRENHASILLEPMNPFDRRIIHTTLNDIADVYTESEGEGLYKQVRVFYKR